MQAVAQPVRAVLRAEGFAVLVLSVLLYWHSGAGWRMFFGLLLVPDVAMLCYLINPRAGAAAYNCAHNYAVPLVLAAAAVVVHAAHLPPYLLIWTAHIGMDRMLCYGLKYPSGFKETHLGSAGV